MAVVTSGTQSASLNTEHTLHTITNPSPHGVYQLVVDTGAMVEGTTPDETELRIYGTCLSAGTERLIMLVTLRGAQAEPLKYSVPVPADVNWRATLKQVAGTGRSYPWKVFNLAA